MIDHGRQAPTLEAYQVHVGSMRASSRGWLKLASKDPRQHPLIDPNYLDSEQDRWQCYTCIVREAAAIAFSSTKSQAFLLP